MVKIDARRSLCSVSKKGVVANHPRLRFGTQMQAPWASQFEVVTTIVAATTDGMASAWLDAFTVAASVVNLDGLGGSRRKTVV